MVSGEVPEHPLLDDGRKGQQLSVKAQIRRNPAYPLTLPDGLIKHHCRAPRKKG
jgi:hypothetical protein